MNDGVGGKFISFDRPGSQISIKKTINELSVTGRETKRPKMGNCLMFIGGVPGGGRILH